MFRGTFRNGVLSVAALGAGLSAAGSAEAQMFMRYDQDPETRIERQISRSGYRLAGPVQYGGGAVVADVSREGHVERWVLDPESGHLLKRFRARETAIAGRGQGWGDESSGRSYSGYGQLRGQDWRRADLDPREDAYGDPYGPPVRPPRGIERPLQGETLNRPNEPKLGAGSNAGEEPYVVPAPDAIRGSRPNVIEMQPQEHRYHKATLRPQRKVAAMAPPKIEPYKPLAPAPVVVKPAPEPVPEVKPSEPQPVVVKPMDAKPLEMKPVEPAPDVVKPVETKRSSSKPVKPVEPIAKHAVAPLKAPAEIVKPAAAPNVDKTEAPRPAIEAKPDEAKPTKKLNDLPVTPLD